MTLRGGSENDLLRGGYAQDLLSGGSGDDVIYAGDGRDMVFGGDGDDTLRDGIPFRIGDGSTGHSEIFSGGAGNDYIVDNGKTICGVAVEMTLWTLQVTGIGVGGPGFMAAAATT